MTILENKIIDYYRKPKITDSFSTYLDQTEEFFEHSFFDQDHYRKWSEKVEDNYFSKAVDGYLISKEFHKYVGICLEKMPTS